MATLKDFRDERLRKLHELKNLDIDPYPANSVRNEKIGDIINSFKEFEGKEVVVSGRIKSIRKFGKIAFLVLQDFFGEIQIFLKDGELKDTQLGLKQLSLLDTGDFIEVVGVVGKTQTGEKSVLASGLRILTKSLRPLPLSHEEFSNKEERFRRRYVDMNINIDVRDRFIRRSKFWQATRDFLNKNGFIEINNAVLENTAGGADASPFITHMDALDQDFYLRISHELPLKKLLVAGFEKIYDIGPRFRNENYSDEHLPEHIAMEWYWAYADWKDGMDFTEKFIRYVCDETWGTRKFNLKDYKIDFGKDGEHYERISFVDVLSKQYGIDVFESSMSEIQEKLRDEGLEVEKIDNRIRSLDKLWKKYRKALSGPAFLIDIPVFMQPLAKANPKDKRLSEQFNLVFAGSEMCKAYSELNDPVDQFERFVEQQKLRDAGDDEAQMMDIDFVEALEYGMPPACGYGSSERVFWALEGVSAKEGVPFPHLRREIDEVTKGIYPGIDIDENKSKKK